MNKICTSLEQSKKLIELGVEASTADMCYNDGELRIGYAQLAGERDDYFPAWSLTALLNYLREIDFFPEIDADELTVTMSINYVNDYEAKRLTPLQTITVKAENFIDVCYEMILKLNERKLL